MRVRVRQIVALFACFVTSLTFFVWFHLNTSHRAALLPSKLNDKIQKLFGNIATDHYLKLCLSLPKWNSSSKWPPIETVAERLMLKNGESIFVNGIEQCGVWLKALHSKYAKSTITAVDGEVKAISFAEKDVNFTSKVAFPHQLKKINFPYGTQFDHGLTEDSLSRYPAEKQCDALKQMLPLIKGGGSVYIGHNYEKCQSKETDKIVEYDQFLAERRIQALPTCFWTNDCLSGRPDIYEVLYDNQYTLYDEHDKMYSFKNNPCRTSVYIYKHVQVNQDRHKDKLLFDSKFREPWAKHPCSFSKYPNKTHLDKLKGDKESIKGALIAVKPWPDVIV